MARQLATREEIKAEMQRRIENSNDLDGDCRECGAPGVQLLAELDEHGCNWSAGWYQGPPECRYVIQRIVADVQALYNVRE